MDKKIMPRHIGIIMDGNGRWAESKGKNRSYGHQVGSKNVERIISHGFNLGIECITLYAFSTENFARPKEEVDELMRLLGEYITKLTAKAQKNQISVRIIGDKSALDKKLLNIIDRETVKTANFRDKTLNICINYGGRQEICKAVKELNAEKEEVTVENIEKHLYTASNLPLDLIIRTGGEIRLSNFLLFQSAYAELYFTEVLWPDFDEKQFDEAIENFEKRKRNFGKVPKK